MYRIADIKLGRQSAAFAKAYIAAIHVDFEIGFDAVKLDKGLFLLPAFRKRKPALVCPGRVV